MTGQTLLACLCGLSIGGSAVGVPLFLSGKYRGIGAKVLPFGRVARLFRQDGPRRFTFEPLSHIAGDNRSRRGCTC